MVYIGDLVYTTSIEHLVYVVYKRKLYILVVLTIIMKQRIIQVDDLMSTLDITIVLHNKQDFLEMSGSLIFEDVCFQNKANATHYISLAEGATWEVYTTIPNRIKAPELRELPEDEE